MRKRMMWTQTAKGALAGAARRVFGFAFGKAIAFTYAVIVSVVANVVFTLVRDPPHTGAMQPMKIAAIKRTDGAEVRVPLPGAPPLASTVVAPGQMPPASGSLAPSATAESGRPGPGSGGLY